MSPSLVWKPAKKTWVEEKYTSVVFAKNTLMLKLERENYLREN